MFRIIIIAFVTAEACKSRRLRRYKTMDNFVFHKTPGNNYGGIDEYALDKFKGDSSLYNDDPIKRGNFWYGQHPNEIVYTSFSDTYGISDKIISVLG